MSSVEVIFYHALMELLHCVQPSTPPSGFCQVEGFLQSFPKEMEERKEREVEEEQYIVRMII